MRIYDAVPENLAVFHAFFRTRLLPAVREDPDSRRAQQRRATLPPVINSQEETFMSDTVVEPPEP